MNELDVRLTRRYLIKVAAYLLLSAALYVLCTARGPLSSVQLLTINLMPFFVAALAFFEGPYLAGCLGVWCGLLLSLGSSTVEGAESLGLALLGVACGSLGVTYMRRIVLSGLACGAVYTLLRGVVSAVYYRLFYGIDPLSILLTSLTALALALVPGLLCWQLVAWINGRFAEEE